MDGLILIDKPPGVTSHDAVARLRRILKQQRVGHFGTLDPLATGLLLVAVGRVVRLFPFYSKMDKAYTGEIRLGFSTDTYDALGKASSPEAGVLPDRDRLAAAMRKLVGRLDQVPPPYSAKKIRGRPAYEWARAQEPVTPEPVSVMVYSFDLTDYAAPLLSFMVKCSSGTYVRALAHELGQGLGCGAHLFSLRRRSVGGYDLRDAHSLAEVERLTREGKPEEFLLAPESLLPEYPKAVLTTEGLRRLDFSKVLGSGHVLAFPESEEEAIPHEKSPAKRVFRLFNREGRLVGLAERRAGAADLVVCLRLG
jgi:tRNA pseudouridine55 synthase